MLTLTPQEKHYLAVYMERYDVAAILAESGDPALTPQQVRARILRLWRAERNSSERCRESGLLARPRQPGRMAR